MSRQEQANAVNWQTEIKNIYIDIRVSKCQGKVSSYIEA